MYSSEPNQVGSEEDEKRASRINDVCIHPICSSLVQLRLCHFDDLGQMLLIFQTHLRSYTQVQSVK